jgi:hypothetical protein
MRHRPCDDLVLELPFEQRELSPCRVREYLVAFDAENFGLCVNTLRRS